MQSNTHNFANQPNDAARLIALCEEFPRLDQLAEASGTDGRTALLSLNTGDDLYVADS